MRSAKSHARTAPRCGAPRDLRRVRARAARALALNGFLAAVEKLAGEIRGLELHDQVDHVVQSSGLIEHYKKEKGERGEARVENLKELVSAARGFSPDGETDMQPLESFLAHAVLESGEGQADAIRTAFR